MADADPEEERRTQMFNEACTKLQGYFGDFLVLVRIKNGYIMRRTNDTWARGAALSFVHHIDTEDLLEQQSKFWDEKEKEEDQK